MGMTRQPMGNFTGKSAYDQAVEGGYTGTEEQFGELLAMVSDQIVSGAVNDAGDLILTTASGDEINAGPVVGAPGAPGSNTVPTNEAIATALTTPGAPKTALDDAIAGQIAAAGLVATKDAIVGIGHSMMEDTGSTTGGWVLDLAAEFGVPGTNFGASGEPSTGIALRWGIPVYVTFPSGTIPGSTSPVSVTVTPASSWRDFGYGGGLYAADGSLIATGSLSHASSAFTFTRSTAGSAVAVTGPVEFRPTAANTHLGDIAVIWAGVNNSAGSPGRLMDYLPDLHALVDSLSTDRYVIIGDLPTTTQPKGSAQYTALSALWDAIENDFGKAKFIRLNETLVSQGLDMAGINPTATDRANIANSVAPNSLRSDGFHPNQTGYAVVRKIVGQRIRQLGYLPQGGRPVDVPAQPTGLTAGTPTETTMPLTCSASAGALGYRFNYKPAGGTAWIIGAISATPAATIEGLVSGTSYDYQSVPVNAAGLGPASATITAATAGSAPTLLKSDGLSRTSALLNGSAADAIEGAAGFTYGNTFGNARGGGGVIERLTADSSVRLGPLTPMGGHEFYIEAKVGAVAGAGLGVWESNSDYFFAITASDGSVQGTAKIANGSTIPIAGSGPGAIADGDVLGWGMLGNAWKLYINRVVVANGTLAGVIGTNAGMRLPQAAGVHFRSPIRIFNHM